MSGCLGVYDVIIHGFGLGALTLFVALRGKGLAVSIVCGSDVYSDDSRFRTDDRSLAISAGTAEMLSDCGIWEDVVNHSGQIMDVVIRDMDSQFGAHYSSLDVNQERMGYVVPFGILYDAIRARSDFFNLADHCYTIDRYEDVSFGDCMVTVDVHGGTIFSSLLVCASGKNSYFRENGDFSVHRSEYWQHSLICNLRHELPHFGIAVEKFFEDGPIALLPRKDSNTSGLVWTVDSCMIDRVLSMPDDLFIEDLMLRIGDVFGKIESISDRVGYPLSAIFVKKPYSKRLVLVSDSAHCIHPIAGQGFNLAVRDVMVLGEYLLSAKRLGQDLGSYSLLRNYAADRFLDSWSVFRFTHAVNWVFRGDKCYAKHMLRKPAILLSDKIRPLKRMIISHAMGHSSFKPFSKFVRRMICS